MHTTPDRPYYRDGKLGWYEINPGNANEPRAWPPFDRWADFQVGFFTFDGPNTDDTPDGHSPQLVLTYQACGEEEDPSIVAALSCNGPLHRGYLLRFVSDALEANPGITPEEWRQWFDYGMPRWVNELY